MSNTARAARRTAAVCTTATLLGAGLAATAVPAWASLTGPGVDAGQNITVFHNIDFVGVFGYGPTGSVVTVDVIRAGVRIGTVTAPTVDTPEGPGLEINHGPVGLAQPGDCWEGTTPDIQPGEPDRGHRGHRHRRGDRGRHPLHRTSGGGPHHG